MPKILYISNIAGKSLSIGFLGSALIASKELGLDFHSVANRSASTPEQIKLDEDKYNLKLHHIDLSRSPFSMRNVRAFNQLCKIIREEQIDQIHCNTPTGGLLGRLAGCKCGVKKVIYQVHGFHFHDSAPLLNWAIYYPIERILARYTDALITINTEDYQLAKKRFKMRRNGNIYYVPGVGIDLSKIKSTNINRNEKRRSLGINPNDLVLISAGRLDINKNNETTIKAIAQIPNVKLLLCGEGNQRKRLENLVDGLDVKDKVRFLGNRADIFELYQAADVFVLMSFREGLSRSIMEAMASGLPCIVSNIRGNVDLIKEGEGGFLCNPKDYNDVYNAICRLQSDKKLRDSMKVFNMSEVNKFEISLVAEKMKDIYLKEFAK